jgi:hypothetical protein
MLEIDFPEGGFYLQNSTINFQKCGIYENVMVLKWLTSKNHWRKSCMSFKIFDKMRSIHKI